ncbi:MAG TPA: transglycosylase SLT domain-containing protein [Lacunisphaera sp.]|nr:transglycosylase SLT domain-containing protein [Lacunisphaera sp.]
MRRVLLFLLVVALPGMGRLAAAPPDAVAVLVVTGDMHSAYERTAQFVALVDRLKADHPDLPLAILLNGDTQEYGNSLARRSGGEIDFALYAALGRRAPTLLNLGNHEADYFALEETVARVEATGVRVVSNMVNRGTGQPFAPAMQSLRLGAHTATVVGLATDNLATYRVAVRPTLDLADPVAWAREHFPKLLAPGGESEAPPEGLTIILSHCGLVADKQLLALVPDGTLFAGAHNHLRFVEPFGQTRYFQSGSWTQHVSLAWLCREEGGCWRWEIEQVPVPADGPADPEMAALVRDVQSRHLTAEERAVVGQAKRAMGTAEAGQFVAQILREGARADAAFIGNTTFGAGLPAGDVTQLDFDACVRFDGPIYTAVVDGARLQTLLAAANQGPETPFAERGGEFSFAHGPAVADPARRYRIATTDWCAKNTSRYFGEPAIVWREKPELRLKALVRARLVRDRVVPFPAAAAAAEERKVADQRETPGEPGRDVAASVAGGETFVFPSKQEWDEFAARLQAALESNDLRRLAAYEPEARAALVALRALPEYQDYADWLAERVDYIAAARQAVTTPVPKPRPAQPAPPAPGPSEPESESSPPTPAAEPEPLDIPSYALWLERMKTRTVPARAPVLLPRVQKIFLEEGVPVELAWLAESESAFNPAARSPVGAKGLFQLMPETAKSLGLQIFLPDERTDTEKSARAAAQYLRYLHARFGDWLLVLAAYNAGEGRVGRTLRKANARTFAEIAAELPAETRMYVPKVMATIEVRAGIAPAALPGPG